MIQQDVIDVYVRLSELGLVPSRRAFAAEWCGRSHSLITDYERRPGKSVRAGTVATLRMRLREAADALPAATAAAVMEIEADCARAASWTGQIQRRAAMAEAA